MLWILTRIVHRIVSTHISLTSTLADNGFFANTAYSFESISKNEKAVKIECIKAMDVAIKGHTPSS